MSSARHSSATKRLRSELAARGINVTESSLESWAQEGLAPRAVRIPRGRKGSTSAYPPDAVEQYAQVAAVMQRGRDKRLAMLMLVGRGGLPTSRAVFRRALRHLFDDPPDAEWDRLAVAEAVYDQAVGDRLFARFAAFMYKNADEAALVDPVTKHPMPTASVVQGAFVNGLACFFGRPFPDDDAVTEIAAAWGFLGPEVDDEEQARRRSYIEAIYEDALNFDTLREAAETVRPERLQAAVREYLDEAGAFMPDVFRSAPRSWTDVWAVLFGLVLAVIQDLGGADWFERATGAGQEGAAAPSGTSLQLA